MRSLLTFIVLVISAGVWADDTALKESDFLASQDIETEGTGPIYRLELVEAVYRRVSRGDLGDLRIFNADGSVIPHSFQYRTSETVFSTSSRSLPFFPIDGVESTAGDGNSEIVLSENKEGSVVKVTLKGKQAGSKLSRVGYLVDLRKENLPLRNIIIDWSSKQQNGIVALSLSASDDLREWRSIDENATIAKFAFQGENLEKNAIDLPDLRAKFLRITWRQDPSFELKKVSGEFVNQGSVDTKRLQTEVGAMGGEKGEYHFERPPFTADRINVLLPELNTLVRVSIDSRDSANLSWTSRFQGAVYRIQTASGEVASGPEKISPTSDRYWRVRVEGKEASLGAQSPKLQFNWVTHQLYFLARGKGPYRIAYGSAKVVAPDFGFHSLIDALPKAEHGIEPLPARLVGTERISVQPVVQPELPAIPWKKYALWGFLGGFLLLSAFMAWKVYSDLNKESSK